MATSSAARMTRMQYLHKKRASQSTKQKQHKDIDSWWHCWTELHVLTRQWSPWPQHRARWWWRWSASPHQGDWLGQSPSCGCGTQTDPMCLFLTNKLNHDRSNSWLNNKNGINIPLYSTCSGRAWWQSQRWVIYVSTLFDKIIHLDQLFFQEFEKWEGTLAWPSRPLLLHILEDKVINN